MEANLNNQYEQITTFDITNYILKGTKVILKGGLHMVEKQFVCMKEAAEILGIDSRTMKKILENAVDLKWTRVGGKILINKDNLVKYFDEHRIVRFK